MSPDLVNQGTPSSGHNSGRHPEKNPVNSEINNQNGENINNMLINMFHNHSRKLWLLKTKINGSLLQKRSLGA